MSDSVETSVDTTDTGSSSAITLRPEEPASSSASCKAVATIGQAAAAAVGRGGDCWGTRAVAAGDRLKVLIAEQLAKDELKQKASSSLPPLFYDGKSDLCTLGSRPGMECVPLRSPADPYHYHHVTDQTKSLQELQNEVGALLEFRDLVIETFPDLKTKMASSTANSTLTGIPSSSLASSRREWEPGIRSRRKLTQKDASAEIHQHSSSLTTRSRSNSHSGKKEPKSGEGNNGSVVQDSGFSTETSSSKETHSASSTSGGVQGTIVSNTTNRLTVDTEDELWNLLDVIHRKSNRLREEVDALQQLEREKCRTNQLNNNHTNVVGSTSSGSNSSSNNSNLINTHHSSSGNLLHHTHQPPGVSSATTSVVPAAAGGSLAKSFQTQLLVDAVNKDDVQILRKERDRLFDKLSEYEAEAIASRIRASKMQDEVDALASAKQDLESQLKAALSQKLELNSKIHDLHQQFVNKSAPSSPESIKSRHPLTPGFRKHSSTDSTTTIIAISSHLSSSPSSSAASAGGGGGASASASGQPHVLKTRFNNQSSFAPVKSVSSTKISVPVIPSAVMAVGPADKADLDTTSPTATTVSSSSPSSSSVAAASSGDDINNPLATRLNYTTAAGGPSADATLGKLDGLISSPARLSKVRMTDSKKIAAILLETNIVELQRHLLTITVQNQVLQQRLDHATRSRIFLSKKLDKSKEDIDDLKFRLEEKSIELEGTKAQLRVLESKQSGKSSGAAAATAAFNPEHHHQSSSSAGKAGCNITVVSTSAGGIVSHQQHRTASSSTTTSAELVQPQSPVHQHLHHHQHQQQQRDLALRLQQSSQVSTPSMKAMIPLAMDEMLHHSSSTESAQDQAERDSSARLQCPETPRRRPSKIPLPGTKGYVAPKPPTGRNFVASQQHPRAEKNSPSPSGSLTNKSLNKSTGSLYIKSTGPSSITSAAGKDKKDTSLNRPESAQSWRRDASLEKSRSSSIPVSKGSPVAKQAQHVVSNSPLPKAKRDSLTTRVKNLDSLSRLQTASASTGNLSKSSSKKDLSSSFTTGQLRDRKQSASAIRRVSSASVGRSSSTEQNNNNNGSSNGSSPNSPAAAAATSNDGSGSTDGGKARRTKTFRLEKPTMMLPLEVTIGTASTKKKPSPLYYTNSKSSNGSNNNNNKHNSKNISNNNVLPMVVVPPRLRPSTLQCRTLTAVHSPTITSSTPIATAIRQPICPISSSLSPSSSSSTSAESSPSSVTTVTTVESHSSTGPTPTPNSTPAAGGRGLIGEYLAAKSRSQQQQQQVPPPIFSPTVTSTGRSDEPQDLDLDMAYKHPILLMDDDDPTKYCSVVSSVGNERNREVEVKFVEDNSIELLDAAKDEEGDDGEKESLIVPKPKMIAFCSPPKAGSPVKSVGLLENGNGKCRLVGKVNPNILKTWEQLSGGSKDGSERRRKNSRNSLITVTSSENSGDKQSCLIFYRNQFNVGEEAADFTVNRIRHNDSVSVSASSATMEDESDGRMVGTTTTTMTMTTTATVSMVTSSTTTETSSEGCYDFYDSIDAGGGGGGGGGNRNRMQIEYDEEDYDLLAAAGEGLADFTSLDRKKLMWSIDVE
ncbi:uncharacterized protein LOC128732898 [Sabethes cyaneus]|uniref:uncharacterized protein LOC128732898 n=1 Tax=Sabethes cyaneus TaxID=53552 RepID=UPI00237E4BA5|nr:uncharacterized protein LOC128732898 [Sabethes cyaneus]